MIQIICKSESYTYNAYHILKAFYPSQEVSCKTDEKASNYVMVHLPDDREISVGFENTVEITDTAGRDESTGKIQEDSEKESQKKQESRLRGECLRECARPSLLCRNWKPDGKKKIILTGHGKVRE